MTRINTNVSSLVAQNTLSRSNASLNEALTRLSTGLRINTGKDDPAGLIASENLRSDITSIRRAISNTDRANQVIATADSALGQVSSLLNDIRGLVTESANAGALSDEQLSANQLQLDSSLEALNRIAQTTTFQGRRLLDGSLDFITSSTDADFSNITDLNIDQANLGTTGSISVDIDVTTAATKAQVDIENVPAATTPVAATATIDATNSEVDGEATLTIGGGSILVTTAAGQGDLLNGITTIVLNLGAASDNAAYAAGPLTVDVPQPADTADLDDVAAVIAAEAEFATAVVTSNETISAAEAAAATAALTTTGRDAGDADIVVTAAATGTGGDGTTITIAEVDGTGNATPTATYDSGTDTITVNVEDDGVTALSAINTAINNLADFDAALTVNSGDGNYDADTGTAGSAGADNINAAAAFAGGVEAGGLVNAVVLELAGTNGAEVLSFGANTTLTELVDGINLVSDATGVEATANGTTLELTSSSYGSDAIVDLSVIDDTAALFTDSREVGTNIAATVNGVTATGDSNVLTINTATLDLTATLAAGFTGTASFDITGGGALFQLGPDVVSNQQTRLGVGSVNTAQLGGASGKLFELGTGGANELTSNNLDVAASIVQEAIDEVTSLRGRLGAFQRATLETNKQALNDTLVNLTEAESSIRDADFASESAALTRSQILVQSGITVLQIANQNPQNVLALLR
ncbi:MAG TPA: flagellin [Planctomycetaceae bacterium]|nr:flagellin [Planctomycetaceae bacterium]